MSRWGIAVTPFIVVAVAGCEGSSRNDSATTTASAAGRGDGATSPSVGMPLGDFGIRQQDEGVHDYRIDQDAIIQVMVLVLTGALPVSPLAGGTGYRIDSAPEGSVLALAGLQPGDEVTAINGLPLSGPEGLQRAYTLLRSSKAVVVTVIRKGQPLAYNYEVSRTALSRSDRFPSRRRPRSPSRGPKLETLTDDIQQVGDNTYELSPSLVEELTSEQIMRSARILPKLEDGKVVGMKIYGIRRKSLLGSLGFKNGDTVTTINGQPVTSPEAMLALYAKVEPKPGAEARVELLRKNQPITLRYRIRSAKPRRPPIVLPKPLPSLLPPLMPRQ